MKVIKRNGQKIDFNPNKILLRIKKQSTNLKVNVDDVFIKVTQGLADNMTTSQLDDLISVVAESLGMNHPDYSKLAANIAISRLHKETEDSFMKATKKLWNAGLLNEIYYNKVKENIDLIESVIDYNRDYHFDYFGWCSLKDIYLLKIGNVVSERPQQLYARIALMLTKNENDFKEYFNDLCHQGISPATPIKINIGTKIAQIASCFDEDTNVYTVNKGWVKIKNIEYGDVTPTHTGGYKRVLKVWENELNNRQVIKFTVEGIENSITCTENHEFYSLKQENQEINAAKFISIGELTEGDLIKTYKDDQYIFSKIISKEYITYDKSIVYNLEIEDDHSYCVEGVIAKNCNLSIVPDDSREGILNILNRISIASSKAEGIGLAISNLRSKESHVGNSDGKAGGVLKFLKMVNEHLRFFNQRGKRPGSCAVYIEPWHRDIFDVLDIRKKTGDESLRARDLFTALWIPDNFMRAVTENKEWYLFCPNDIKKAGLKPFYEIYGEEYEIEYNKAVELGIGKKIKAQDLWLKIIEGQIETGIPYICFKDHANKKSNHKNINNLSNSNLCAEIFQAVSPNTTAICTLTSVPLQHCIVAGKFDFELLGKRCKIIVKTLNNAIDINEYSTKEGDFGGKSQRALGIGVQGLADVYAVLKMPFTSPEARKLNKEIFETMYYYTLKASCELAKETGLTYDHFEGSPFSKGELQWHMWTVTETNEKNETVTRPMNEKDLSGMYDWKSLINDIKKYGVRNSMLLALPPTASSARVIGSNEAFEPFTSNLYVRKVTGGEFAMVNKHLVRDLEEQNLWNRDILNELIKNNGSIQNIPVISDELKERYKTVWEIPQSILLEMSAERGPFIDQSQSLNIFMSTPTVSKLTSSHVKAWKLGLKTGQYYLRSEAVDNKAKHLAIDMSEPKKERPEGSQFECTGCSS